MRKTSKGSSFQGGMFRGESETETRNNLIETYISLSSTEAKWYAATSAVCDSLFLHHIFSFLTDDEVGPVILHTDNSAVKMLSNKLGAGRLRHVKGRILWLQAKVLSCDLLYQTGENAPHYCRPQHQVVSQGQTPFPTSHAGFVCSGEKVGETESS